MLTCGLSNQVPRTRVDACSGVPYYKCSEFPPHSPELADLSVSTIMKSITTDTRHDIASLTNQTLLPIFITSEFVVQ